MFVGGVKMLFAQQLATRPNILFIIADDWSYGHCSILGDSAVKTPTFDSLSKAGTFFTQAHCTAPSCTPSRASVSYQLINLAYKKEYSDLLKKMDSELHNWMHSTSDPRVVKNGQIFESAPYYGNKTK